VFQSKKYNKKSRETVPLNVAVSLIKKLPVHIHICISVNVLNQFYIIKPSGIWVPVKLGHTFFLCDIPFIQVGTQKAVFT
jgi:hypothetical protein